ncbi:MAG: hypothetical protein ACRDKH_07060 [Solirubrobacterales bacterium]
MSFAAYLAGVLGLAAVAVPIGFAAVRLRARLLPAWEGAPARLAEAVIGAAILTLELQLLGALGIFEPLVIVAAAIAIGIAAHLWVGEGGTWRLLAPDGASGAPAEAPPAPPIPTVQLLIALGAAAFLCAHWATGLQDVWARGMLTFDTLWYHGPFAARIAEAGTVWPLHFTDPLYLNWFYPQNSELVHGAGIALFDRDLISPLVNFAWLGLCLLAAWCIGRPYGVAPLSLLAVVLVLDTGPFVPREAGTPANDVAPAAGLLAAAALLINAWSTIAAPASRSAAGKVAPRIRGERARGRPPAERRRALVILGDAFPAALLLAGLAMGLALGTKLTIASATAAIAVGIPLVVPREIRVRATLLFLAGVAATAGFWFARNLIHSGNPLPWFGEIGGIDLPGPDRGLEGRDNFTVAHYLFVDPETSVWSQYFYEPITNLFGPGWFLFFGLAVVGAVLAIARPRTSVVRMLGAVAIAAAVAYLFTPLTAAGPEGEPIAFGINVRYLIPALALALALLTLEPKLTPERLRLPLLGGGVIVLLLTSLYSDSAYIWDEPFASIPVAAVIGVALVAVPVGIALIARRRAALAVAVGTAAALAVAAVGWERQDDYLDARYTRSEDFRFQLDEAARWAKPRAGERIGVVGSSGAFSQYVLYGDELSNRVEYIGRTYPSGDFRTIAEPKSEDGGRGPGKCADFRGAVNDGDYDFVVATPKLDLNDPRTATASPEAGWLRGADGADEVVSGGRVAVFEISGELDPATCGRGRGERS